VSELGDSAEREFSRRLWGKELTNSEIGQIWRESADPHYLPTRRATELQLSRLYKLHCFSRKLLETKDVAGY
jgi:hypothetical protein